MIFLLIIIVVGIVLIARASWGHHGYHHYPTWHAPGEGGAAHRPPSAPGAKTPLELLDERYARGDIERDDYLQRKQDLLGR